MAQDMGPLGLDCMSICEWCACMNGVHLLEMRVWSACANVDAVELRGVCADLLPVATVSTVMVFLLEIL